MSPENVVWKKREKSLQKAGKRFREKSPEALHDLRVALRRVSATANALGRGKLAKRSKKMVQSLSDLRQIEIDRELLARVRELGWLPEEVAAGVDARWDALLKDGEKEAARKLPDAAVKRVRRTLTRLSKKKQQNLVAKLEKARERADEMLATPPHDPDDRVLHRYRLAVKRARYLTEDLAVAGRPGLEADIERKKRLQDALGRWNDLRLFRRDLASTRDEAERRGAISFVVELDRLVAALDPAVTSARQDALRMARPGGTVSARPSRLRRVPESARH